jgi:uncharacterized phosphosugar-binding protein
MQWGNMKAVFDTLHTMLRQVEETQAASIHTAGQLVADCLARDGIIHMFGTGHSHILAEELFFRAGGLSAVNPIFDAGLMLHESALTSTDLERLEGYAPIVFSRYTFSPNDIIIIISNSGRNAAPIEAAMEARQRKLPVIAVTAKSYSQGNPSRHSSGKRLFELADVVLDNCGLPGDGAVQVEGLPERICPTSTIMGATLLHAVIYEAVSLLLARGIQPAVIRSANLDSTQDLGEIVRGLRGRVRHL